MEMHTVGSGMRLGVVQSKDPAGTNPTTLKRAAPDFILKGCSWKYFPGVFGDEGMSSFASDEQFVGLIRQEQTGTSLQDQVSRLFEEARDDVYRYLLTLGLYPPQAQEAAHVLFVFPSRTDSTGTDCRLRDETAL